MVGLETFQTTFITHWFLIILHVHTTHLFLLIEAMIGDVNLYLSTHEGMKVAECGIMIAEDSARGQGKGLEALLLMLNYGNQFFFSWFI